MKKFLVAMALGGGLFALSAGAALADTVGPISFDSYALGTINGQDGWTATGSAGFGCALYDEAVSSSLSTSGFGTQSFRVSDAVTSGCFGDNAFAKPLTNAAGEADSTDGTFSPGTLQPHFEAQFDIFAIPASIGDVMSVSPDRGDGSRMSYLRFDNESDGIHVYFDDASDPTQVTNADTFNELQIALLPANVPHTIKFSMDFYNGPGNDVVQIYIDGKLVHTGTSWEDFYRYDSEQSAEQSPRIVKTLMFHEGGTAHPADAGKGYLIDNLSLESGPIPTVASVCSTINLVSSTNTMQAGYDQAITLAGPSDGLNATNYSNEGFIPAFLTQTVIPPWVNPSVDANFSGSGAAWISTDPTWPGHAGNTEGSYTDDQWRLFQDGFVLPAGAVVSSATVSYTADNAADVYLNGNTTPISSTTNTYGASPAGNPQYYGEVFTAPFTPTTGYNSLNFVVRNWNTPALPDGTNPTGLLYKATVNYCIPPTTGTLVVTKKTVGGNGTFNFSGPTGIGTFSLTTTGGAASQAFNNLTPGSYTITETAATGWTQSATTCTNVSVVAGGTATCTITNTKKSGNVTVINSNNSVVITKTTSSSSTGGNTSVGGSGGKGGGSSNSGTGGKGGSSVITTGKATSNSSSVNLVNFNVTNVKKH